METLTVQAYLNETWTDIALIKYPGSENNDWNTTQLDYLTEYAINFLNYDDFHAVSVNHPVSLFFDDRGQPGWLRFIDDIIPAGASRRYWINALDISELPVGQQNFLLLKFGTMSPVGNLRIKESVPEWNEFARTKTFTVADVIDRAADFLDYAQKEARRRVVQPALGVKRRNCCCAVVKRMPYGSIPGKTNRITGTAIIWLNIHAETEQKLIVIFSGLNFIITMSLTRWAFPRSQWTQCALKKVATILRCGCHVST